MWAASARSCYWVNYSWMYLRVAGLVGVVEGLLMVVSFTFLLGGFVGSVSFLLLFEVLCSSSTNTYYCWFE